MKKLLSVAAYAKLKGISRIAVYKQIKKGKLKPKKITREVFAIEVEVGNG